MTTVISEQILSTFIGFGIGVFLYLVITACVNEYIWWKMKRHLTEAIEALNLWDAVNERVITVDLLKSIATYLDAHKYRHHFHGHGGAFWLKFALSEIMAKREKGNKEKKKGGKK